MAVCNLGVGGAADGGGGGGWGSEPGLLSEGGGAVPAGAEGMGGLEVELGGAPKEAEPKGSAPNDPNAAVVAAAVLELAAVAGLVAVEAVKDDWPLPPNGSAPQSDSPNALANEALDCSVALDVLLLAPTWCWTCKVERGRMPADAAGCGAVDVLVAGRAGRPMSGTANASSSSPNMCLAAEVPADEPAGGCS